MRLEGESKENRTTDLDWAFLMLAGVDVVGACLGSKKYRRAPATSMILTRHTNFE